MPSEKRLNSVCHNIAHHAVSGLSYIHPHLRRACKAVGLEAIVIDLGTQSPCPAQFQSIEPLRLSLASLRNKFIEILRAEGFSETGVAEVKLLFEFTQEFPDDYCSNCHARIVLRSGKVFRDAVNFMGNRITPSDVVSRRSDW